MLASVSRSIFVIFNLSIKTHKIQDVVTDAVELQIVILVPT